MLLTVAIVGAPHGLKGEVRLNVRTDDPGQRLAVGQCLQTLPEERGPLTVASSRWQNGRLYARFEEVVDRNGSEALRGTKLVVDATEEQAGSGEEEGWYAHELRGLRAVHVNGQTLGEVTDLRPGPAHDMLHVQTPAGEVVVPFVEALVPEVDTDGGRVLIDPPGGMFEL